MPYRSDGVLPSPKRTPMMRRGTSSATPRPRLLSLGRVTGSDRHKRTDCTLRQGAHGSPLRDTSDGVIPRSEEINGNSRSPEWVRRRRTTNQMGDAGTIHSAYAGSMARHAAPLSRGMPAPDFTLSRPSYASVSLKGE